MSEVTGDISRGSPLVLFTEMEVPAYRLKRGFATGISPHYLGISELVSPHQTARMVQPKSFEFCGRSGWLPQEKYCHGLHYAKLCK